MEQKANRAYGTKIDKFLVLFEPFFIVGLSTVTVVYVLDDSQCRQRVSGIF
jgi:hypothetical protein